MGCGCGSNFSGNKSISRRDERPALKHEVKQTNWGGSYQVGSTGRNPRRVEVSYSNMSGRKKAKTLTKRFNSFMGRKPQVNLKKHNIPMSEFAAYSTRYSNFNPFETRGHSAFSGKSRVNRNDLRVEF